MTLSTAVVLISLVIAMGALAHPVAMRLRLPASVILALAGIVVGGAAHWSLRHPGVLLPEDFAQLVTNLPIGSSLLLYVFLPTLIFQSALEVDVHRVREDLLPILILALVAVIVATLGIAYAVWPFSGMPLVACLILAALVATTDPVAVIGIFRDVGAPERLTRLVEGESLFNDAAAIALFLVFVGVLVEPDAFDATHAVLSFIVMPLGGAAVGFALAWAFLGLMRFVRDDDRLTAVSLSIAVPYCAFWVAEHDLHVSGIIALVVAGMTLATAAPGRLTGEMWRYMQDIWEQLAAWSGVLIFFMAALLVPKLLAGASWSDMGLLAIVFLAALATRAVIMFGLFPLLSRLGITPPISTPYRVVVLWGGLRGSMTLALALAVTEHEQIPRDVAAFVATFATGYTLMTLFIQGTTLRPLIQWLGLTELTGVDRAVRDIALDATAARVGAFEADMASRFGREVEPRESLAEERERAEALSAEERVTLALLSLTVRERDLILHHFSERIVAPRIARRLVAEARRRLEAVRGSGAEGYRSLLADETAFRPFDRISVSLQRRFDLSRPLARRLSARFETLMETALVLDKLRRFARDELELVLGEATIAEAEALIAERRELIEREIAAVRLQYPSYVRALERWVVDRSLHARELAEIAEMRSAGLVNAEVARDLLRDLERRLGAKLRSPALDLDVDPRDLVDSCELFAPLPEADRADLAKLLKPRFEVPGIPIITRGERGTEAYFISSGAVEIDTGGGPRHRLGRGEIFGELALLFDLRRTASVTAIAYSTMLRLSKADFDAFLARHPQLRARIEAIGRERLDENARREVAAAE